MKRLLAVLPLLWLAACSDSDAPGAPSAAAMDQSSQAAPRSGALLYRQFCVTCHASGVAGAPRVGKEHRLYWSHEVEEEGFDTLVQEAINGINAMPPRGNCFDCSDEEIRNAVIYMMQLSGAK